MLRANYENTIATVSDEDEVTVVKTRFGHVVQQVRTIRKDVDGYRRDVNKLRLSLLGIALMHVIILLYFLIWHSWT